MIVAEEVKTASQGEVIGLFLKEKIPRGMTLARRRSPRSSARAASSTCRTRSTACTRCPTTSTCSTIVERRSTLIEIYNPRVAIGSFNEEAARFAAKYRIPAGAGSDAHVAQGLGSVRVRMRDFDGPEEFLESLREAEIITKPSNCSTSRR